MSLHVALTHETTYHYDRRIGMGPQIVRLRPAPHCRTPILSYALKLEPKTHFLNWQQDPFGNYLARIVLPEETDVFSVTVDLVADMAVINPFEFFIADEAKEWPFNYEPALAKELGPYLEPDPVGLRLRRYLDSIGIRTNVTLDFLCDLNRKLQKDIGYLVRMEPGDTDAGGDAGKGQWIVPRQCLAAWCKYCAMSASPRGSCRAISFN